MTTNAFDQLSLSDLRRRRSWKWQAFPPDVLPAFIAEMDFMLAPPIEAAIAAAVAMGDTGYAWQIPELGEALSGFARDRFAWEIDPADVALLPDVMNGVTEVLRVALKPGDGVVINTPIYAPFFRHVREAGCQVVEAPLEEGFGGYQLDLDAVERAFKAGARGYLLCNPHNPTGRVFARAELEVVAALAARYGVKVFSATKARDREELGEAITRWLRANPGFSVVDKVVTQSSDREFHCLTITLFYKERPRT